MAGEWKKALEKVPADKRAAVEAAINGVGELVTELDAGYLRQEDYSTKMNAWQTEKKTMQSNWDIAKTQYDEMLEDFNNRDATAAQLSEARENLRLANEKLEKASKVPVIDPAIIATKEDLTKELANFGAGQVGYFTEAMDVAYEIEGLLKQRISPGTLLNEALAAKKTPKAYAEEKYELPKKRTEAQAAQKAEDEKRIRDDERGKVVAEFANPATRPLGDSKDPFISVPDKSAVQPWDIKETPADELKLMNELTASRIQ